MEQVGIEQKEGSGTLQLGMKTRRGEGLCTMSRAKMREAIAGFMSLLSCIKR